MLYLHKGHPIPIDSIDVFWRKLDLLSCQSLQDDEIGCEDEVKNFTEEFKKQSRAGKFSFLRKIKEIANASTTWVREPAVNKTTRGRPSLKDKLFRKPHVDPSFTAHVEPSFTPHDQPSFTPQGPLRRSSSNASTFVDLDKTSYQEPARHSSFVGKNYNVHPYVNQFPEMFHRYITHVHDVIGDGNCGFRAIAVWLGLHEDAWPTIRWQLLEELEAYKTEYLEMFGSEDWITTYNTLNFFRTDQGAPYDHWMSMPEIHVLIACKYNVILHVIAMTGSATYLPLRSTPPAWYQHVHYTIGYVNGNHYAKLVFAEGYPFPTITSHFFRFSYHCAAGWATPYTDRIQKYNRLLRVNCTTDNVILE
jgi:histone-lysine N-methyltransferase SETD2